MRKFLLLSLLFEFSISSFSQASDLYFSEYIEGGSYEKYLEIYNGTGGSVNLSNYQILVFSNGAASTDPSLTLTLDDVVLADNDVYVIGHGSATLYTPDLVSSLSGFNGDDAIALVKISTGDFVDIIGCIGEDPGSAWATDGWSTKDKTLVRVASVTSGVKSNPTEGFPTLTTEWDLYDKDDVSHLGSHTMSTPTYLPSMFNTDVDVYPNPFSSQLNIVGDNIKSVSLYNVTGQLIKHVNLDGQTMIYTDDIINGLYLVKITFHNESFIVKRIVKQ